MTPIIRNEFRFFSAVIGASLLVWLAIVITQSISQPDVQPIDSGLYSSALNLNDARRKQLDIYAQPVRLMHYFPVYKMQPTYGVYWFDLPDSCPGSICSLFIPRISLSGEIYVNDQLIGRTGSVATPIANSAFRPYIFDIPQAMLSGRGEKNQLKIVLASEFLERGRLWPIYFAEKEKLDTTFNFTHFLNVTLPLVIAVLLVGGCVLAFTIWQFGIRNKVYLWFSALIGFSALSSFCFHWVEFPYSTELRQNLYSLSGFGVIVCLPRLLHYFYGYRVRVVEWFTLYFSLVCIISIGVLMAINNTDRHFIRALMLTPTFAVLFIYQIGYLVWHRRKIVESKLLVTAVALILFAEMRLFDIFNIATVGHWLSPLSRIGAPFTLLIFIVFFLRGFSHYYRESKITKEALDKKLTEREAEIKQQQGELFELRKNQTLHNERQRIMREMHDGAGGLLVSLILQAKSTNLNQDIIVERLKQTLTDIRLMVDSLDTIDEPLATALGMFRVRMEPLLQTAGIKLIWDINFDNEDCHLSAENTLHVFRILQEACTNVIKHSNATSVTIQANQKENQNVIEIVVTDNGQIEEQVTGKIENESQSNRRVESGSKGLKNMAYRAEQIPAKIEFSSAPTGYSIKLTIQYE